MRQGLKTSLIVHTCVFLLLFLGLPVFNKDRSYEDQVVTVEVLPISELTNVKPKQVKQEQPKQETAAKAPPPPVSKPEPVQKPQEKPKTEPVPKPVKKEEPKKEEPKKPEPVKVKPEEKPKPKPEEKKPEPKKEEPKKEEKPKPKATEDDFAAVIKSVEEGRKQEDQKEKDKETEKSFDEAVDFLSNAKESQYKEGVPLSVSEKGAIRQQIMKNWTVPAGAKDVQNTVVTLHINVQPDGTVSKVEIKDKGRYNSDAFYRAMADSAMRAVHRSSPLQNLPADKYDVRDGWRELEVNFDPSEMVY